ncbi:relaxase/mobilization nuclease domain-containing protein [uncultured Enorma sp.]|uniref:relaxase/mobilization nuclease domain-containing protein n=1 Tax=uncultured Enorma sp. TaxID=1714346 RepID=UPI002803D1F8|nr:relaxase/mobilization nuclease domain-containing protein [uncultured Enorma sp.]
MAVIKQTSVTSWKHLSRLKGYLNWSKDKSLAHDALNIIDEGRWFEEMDETRKSMGHNAPGNAGARCTFMQHQIIAFNPDEISINGDKMTPELCMDYSREYVMERYPHQEVVMVLHLERCKADNSQRLAVHLGINRSNLETSRRLDEGPARRAAAARAKTIRELDRRYGLRQLERGKSNSRMHGRQPGAAERDMARKGQGGRSENARIRALAARRIDEVGKLPLRNDRERLAELSRLLSKDGITLARAKNGSLQYRYHSKSLGQERKINGSRLGFARNRTTGRVTRFTLRGISAAMQLVRETYRDQEQER